MTETLEPLAREIVSMSPPVLTVACSGMLKLFLDKIGVKEWIVCACMLCLGAFSYPCLVPPENSYNVYAFVFQNSMIGFLLGGSPFAGSVIWTRFKPSSRAKSPKDTPSST